MEILSKMRSWTEYGLRGDVNYIPTHWKRWQKYDASLFDAMVVCAICGFTNLCTYDHVSDTHNFSNFKDVEVDSHNPVWGNLCRI